MIAAGTRTALLQMRLLLEELWGGLHIGVSSGDLQIVSLRPCSRTHVGVVGDCIDVAARLMSTAGPGEIVATNHFHLQLDDAQRACFAEIEPVELKNVGKLRG